MGPGFSGSAEEQIETDAGDGKSGQQRHDEGGDDEG
jgi:hypothetical protein